MVGGEFSRKPYAIGVQTGHPLKDMISASILKLLNDRKLEGLKEKWWHQNPKRKDCPSKEDDSTGISIEKRLTGSVGRFQFRYLHARLRIFP